MSGFIDENEAEVLIIHHPLPRNGWNVSAAQQQIQHDLQENLLFYKNNRQLLRFRGETNYVNPPEECLLRMKDCVVIHNHPGGASFSKEDITAVIRYNARQLIVVSPNGTTYVVMRPIGGWNIDFKDENVQGIYEESETIAEDVLNKMVANNDIKLYEKDNKRMHYIWSAFFQLNQIRYVKREKGENLFWWS